MGHDLNALREADIALLKHLNINTICDLMVEDKKKVYVQLYTSFCCHVHAHAYTFYRGWLTVTSSEKVDKEQRYKDFNITSIPYPGCEVSYPLQTGYFCIFHSCSF